MPEYKEILSSFSRQMNQIYIRETFIRQIQGMDFTQEEADTFMSFVKGQIELRTLIRIDFKV